MAFLFVLHILQWSNQTPDNYSRRLTQSDADEGLSAKPVDSAGLTQYVRSALNAIRMFGAPSKSARPTEQVELVQLIRGQLGNSLHIIAMVSLPLDADIVIMRMMITMCHLINQGYIVKFFAKNMDPPVKVNIHYHTNNNLVSRVVDTKNDIKTCFSNFENVDFYEFDDNEKQMIIAHNKYGSENHVGLDVRNEKDFGKLMRKKIKFISDEGYLEFQKTRQDVDFDYFEEKVPYLHCSVFAPPYLIDRYYDNLIKVFQFSDHCCKEKPDPDETVVVSLINILSCLFHFSNKSMFWLLNFHRITAHSCLRRRSQKI